MHEQIICFSGPDAGEFLQAQLTQDITGATNPSGRLAAWCNAKGRVIALGRVLDMGDGMIGLTVASSVADRTAQGLLRFRLRAKVDIGPPPVPWGMALSATTASFEQLGESGFDNLAGFNRSQKVGSVTAVNIGSQAPLIELYGPLKALDALQNVTWPSAHEHSLARIHAGIAQVEAPTSEKFTPHMLSLDLLGAISFDKGCYPGQEIVARTHYLGDSRRRLGRFLLCNDLPASAGDTLVLGNDCKVEVVNAVGRDILAVAPVTATPDPDIAMRQELPWSIEDCAD